MITSAWGAFHDGDSVLYKLTFQCQRVDGIISRIVRSVQRSCEAQAADLKIVAARRTCSLVNIQKNQDDFTVAMILKLEQSHHYQKMTQRVDLMLVLISLRRYISSIWTCISDSIGEFLAGKTTCLIVQNAHTRLDFTDRWVITKECWLLNRFPYFASIC